MDPLQLIRSSGRRFAVVVSHDLGQPMVWVLHRVASPEFLRMAVAALATVEADADRAAELQIRLLGARTDEDRARITAECAVPTDMPGLPSPEQLQSIFDQADSLVMTAVHAFGIGRLDVELTPGLQPIGTKAEDICQPLDEPLEGVDPTYLRPVRWAAPGDVQIDRLQIAEVHESERMHLAGLVVEAFSPAKAAAPTFRGPGAARDGGQVGAPVRSAPKRAGAVRRPAGSGDRSGSAGGG